MNYVIEVTPIIYNKMVGIHLKVVSIINLNSKNVFFFFLRVFVIVVWS